MHRICRTVGGAGKITTRKVEEKEAEIQFVAIAES